MPISMFNKSNGSSIHHPYIFGLDMEAYWPNVAVLPETVEALPTVVQARPEKHSEEDNFWRQGCANWWEI